jgi:hypothetical protein
MKNTAEGVVEPEAAQVSLATRAMKGRRRTEHGTATLAHHRWGF